jgi:hypothetical protein
MMNSLSGNLLAFSQQNLAKFIALSLQLDWFSSPRILLIVDGKSYLVNKKNKDIIILGLHKKNKAVSEIDKIRPFWILPTSVGARRPDQAITDDRGVRGQHSTSLLFDPTKVST